MAHREPAPGLVTPRRSLAEPRGRRRHTSERRRRTLTAFAFMAPSLIILGVFIVYPMVESLRISFRDYSVLGADKFVGLDNYRQLLHDGDFSNALGNTLVYAAITTPVSVGLALLLAMLLNGRIP